MSAGGISSRGGINIKFKGKITPMNASEVDKVLPQASSLTIRKNFPETWIWENFTSENG